jgi:16S rRNA (adenine1518-N6/adenine1519-N6)-dimethyltransferase
MSSLLGAARVKELLRSNGIRPSRSLGQNFVVDPNTIEKVVGLAEIEPADSVLEIGAGLGSLTLGLAVAARRVVAVEKDRRLARLLAQVTAGAPVEVVEGDLSCIEANKCVSNLPYSVAARVVLRVLAEAPLVSSLTVMVQKEVGARLAAVPGSKVYGASSVLVAVHAEAVVAGSVSRYAFWPVPRVDSVVVKLRRKPAPAGAETLETVVRAAFAQRRKSLRNSLAAVAGSPEAAAAALETAGVAPQARAEELSLAQFVSVGRRLGASC